MLTTMHQKRTEHSNVWWIYPANYSGLKHLHSISEKIWWICSKLIIEKRVMEWKCVLRTRGRDHANKCANKYNRTKPLAGFLAEKLERANEMATKVKFAMKTIVDFCNRSCSCTHTHTFIAQFLVLLISIVYECDAQFTFVLTESVPRNKILYTQKKTSTTHMRLWKQMKP